jgi:hypothetical protein
MACDMTAARARPVLFEMVQMLPGVPRQESLSGVSEPAAALWRAPLDSVSPAVDNPPVNCVTMCPVRHPGAQLYT